LTKGSSIWYGSSGRKDDKFKARGVNCHGQLIVTTTMPCLLHDSTWLLGHFNTHPPTGAPSPRYIYAYFSPSPPCTNAKGRQRQRQRSQTTHGPISPCSPKSWGKAQFIISLVIVGRPHGWGFLYVGLSFLGEEMPILTDSAGACGVKNTTPRSAPGPDSAPRQPLHIMRCR
jgi:hypothetical protein